MWSGDGQGGPVLDRLHYGQFKIFIFEFLNLEEEKTNFVIHLNKVTNLRNSM